MLSKNHRLTVFILIAMVMGIGVGEWVHLTAGNNTALKFADNIKLLTTIFLRLVKMVISPLVFSTLIAGIAKMGDLKAVGRVGGKSMLWFVTASVLSLLLGLMLVNYFQPGLNMNLAQGDTAEAQKLLGHTQHFSGIGVRRTCFSGKCHSGHGPE